MDFERLVSFTPFPKFGISMWFLRRREVVDIVTYSMIKKSTTRLVLDLSSLKKIDGVPCYKAKIIYSNDPIIADKVKQEVNVPLEVFNAIRESVIHEIPSGNGYSMIWFAHGFYELERNTTRYIPEYSRNATQIIFIDLDLATQVVYTPDVTRTILDFYTIESSPEARLPERFKMNRSDLPQPQYMICELATKPLKIQVYCGKLVVREDLRVGEEPFAKFVRGFAKSDLKDVLSGLGIVYALKHIAQMYPEYKYDISEIIDKIKRPIITLRDQVVLMEELLRELMREVASAITRAEIADVRAISILREISEKHGLDIMSLIRIREELKPREKHEK